MEEVAPTAIAQSSESALIDLNTMRGSLAKNCARSVLAGSKSQRRRYPIQSRLLLTAVVFL
ncbi:hypothetical protein QC281_43700, partial [Streptomyces sp. DH17]|nr:hypothetical protein [Streptomyces sp. DH17]